MSEPCCPCQEQEITFQPSFVILSKEAKEGMLAKEEETEGTEVAQLDGTEGIEKSCGCEANIQMFKGWEDRTVALTTNLKLKQLESKVSNVLKHIPDNIKLMDSRVDRILKGVK